MLWIIYSLSEKELDNPRCRGAVSAPRGGATAPLRPKHYLKNYSKAHLLLLTDIIAVPKAVPLANLFSVGDVLLTIGVGVLCCRTIRHTPGEQITILSLF